MNERGAIIVSVLATGTFAAVVLLWLLHPPAVQGEVLTVLNVLVGALSAGYGAVINYWLGSSSGSRAKDDTISSLATTSPAAVIVPASASPGPPGPQGPPGPAGPAGPKP